MFIIALIGSHTRCPLLIEPVVMPNMGHLSLDDNITPSDDCLFYPTGQKKLNMKMEFEKTIQSYSTEQPSLSHSNLDTEKGNSLHKKMAIAMSAKSLSKNTSTKKGKTKSNRPKSPLYYTRTSDPTSSSVSSLLRDARRNESDLSSTLNIRT
jgi:hypothetical protein